jgi:plasmid maintenance system killer protein
VDILAGRTISAGSGLVGGGDLTSSRTLSHANTSDQASVSYSGGVVLAGVGLDEYGHVTSFSSVDLDGRYLSASSGVVTGNAVFEGNNHLFGTGGKLGITLNDTQGDLNLTFNHAGGVPDQDGSACRITTSVDNTTGSMTFQVGDGVFQGVSTSLSDILSLTTTGATFSVPLSCTTVSGNGSLLTNLNAANITTGTVSTARLPGAVVDTSPGIVELSDSLTSGSQTAAATSLAVKTLRNDFTSTTISAGNGLSGGGNLSSDITLSHANTSDQASVSYSGGVVLSGVGLDDYGHVTSFSSVDLDSRYLSASGVVSGNLTAEGTSHLFGTSGKFGIAQDTGDLALTFNHAGSIPDRNGSAYRITADVDADTARMTFSLLNTVTAGIEATLTDIMNVTMNGVNITGRVDATDFSGDGSLLTNLNADNITSGTVSAARLPGATTGSSGIVELSNSLTSTSQTTAATSLAARNLQNDIDTRAPKTITISAGNGLTGGGTLSANREIAHGNTSNQTSVTNSGYTVIQSVGVDQYGHVTSLSSETIDVLADTDTRYLPFSGGTLDGTLIAPLYYGALDVSTKPRQAHIQNDGALYRYDGQVYITVDDNLYIRDSSGAATTENYQFHFSTNTNTFTTGKVVANGVGFSGSGAGLTNLPAGHLTGSVPTGVLPVSSTSASGIVRLSTSTSSTSTTFAATSSAVKSVQDGVTTLAGRTISAGNGLSGGGNLGSNISLSHGNTSNQTSVSYSNGVVLSGVGLDEYGHVTSFSSVDLDSRYLSASSGVVSGNAVFQGDNHLFGTNGRFGITINDGQGNLNLTFNHGNGGVPDQNGSACRIETSVDGDVGSFVFEVGDYVTAGVEVSLIEVMRIDTSGVTVFGPLGATSLSGNGSAITSLNAAALSSGTVDRARLPPGSTSNTGIVKLSSSISTDSSVAATPSAVKTAFDLAAGKVSKSGDIMNGQLKIGDTVTTSSYVSGAPSISCGSWIYTKGLVNTGETGTGPAAIIFGDGSTFGTDQISLVANGNRVVYVTDGNVTVNGSLSANTFTGSELIFEANNNSASDKTSIKGVGGQMFMYSDEGWSFVESDTNSTVVSIAQNGGITASSFSGSLAWSHLTGVPSANTSTAGIVRLNSSTDTESLTQAPTLSALKAVQENANNRALKSLTISTSTGLSGGGNLTANRTLSVDSTVFRSGASVAGDLRLSSGNGRGVRFWDSDQYKIYMSATSDGSWGGRLDGSSDYNMYFRMTGGTNQGFVFRNSTTNVAQIDGAGNMYLTGTLQSGTVPWARLSGIPSATTSVTGIVRLSTSINSDSTTQAPTLSALKAVQNNANARVSKSGDTMSGALTATRLTSTGDIYMDTDAALVSSYGSSSNIDHIWHDDGANAWNFCSDTTYRGTGNSKIVAGSFSGNGSALTSLNASNLSSGTVNAARLPDANTGAQGIVQLTNSTSTISSTLAASATAVREANINANNRVAKSGDTMTGYLTIHHVSPTIVFRDTGSNSGFIHVNDDQMYILRGGDNSTTWSKVNGEWPWIFYLNNNNSRCGGNLTVVGSVTAASFSGNGASLTSLNGSNISSGTIDASRLPDASTSAQGVVQLSTSTTSTSTTQAPTLSALKVVQDNANNRALQSITLTAGTGLSGGGNLSANRTFSVDSTVFRSGAAVAGDLRFTIGNGRGVRFWDSEQYKIYMSAVSDEMGGRLDVGASDYNMYFRMANGTNRGFVFKNNTTNVAQIDGAGNLYLTGSLLSGSVSWARLAGIPYSTTLVAGIVKLSTSTTSTSETQAPTLSALKVVQDNANTRALQSTSLTAGTGLSGGGNLSANRTFSVDSTVFRSGASVAGDLRFTESDGRGIRFWDSEEFKIYMSSSGNATWGGRLDSTSDFNMYFRMTGGTNRGFVFQNNTTNVAQIDGGGNIFATSFSGSGASLTSLNGSNISSGTVANARLPNTAYWQTNTWLTSTDGDERFYFAQDSSTYMRAAGNIFFRTGGDTDRMIINSAGNISIGTSSPVAKFDLRGDMYTTGKITLNNTAPTIAFQDTDNNSAFWHCNANVMYLLRGGNNATSWTQVNGQWPMMFDLSNNNATCGGSFSAVGNVTAYASDRRLKQNIQPLENTLDIIKKLGGYTFEWKEVENMPMSGNDVGLIAQDLEEAGLGDLVLTHAPFDMTDDQKGSKSGEFYYTVHYDKLHAVWAQGLKEQQEMIEQQQTENRALRQTVDQLTAQMEKMMARLQMLEEHKQ